jgi:hypothetical protein
VRYTTDGTEPTTTNGSSYTTGTPLSIAAGTTVRARVYSDGVAGPVTDANYILLGTATANGVTPATFASSLPLLVIDTALSTTSTTKTPLPARFALIDRTGPAQTSSLTNTPAFVTRGSIRPRGQTSTGLPKKPYGLEFWDGAEQARDLEVLGMPAESDWVLYAGYQFDTDHLRNALIYEFYRRAGRWAPRVRFVEVFFNGQSGASVDGSDYHGIYLLMEKIKRGGDRVDISDIGPLDNGGVDLTGGYIVAHDKFIAAESLETGGGSLTTYIPQAGTAFIAVQPNYSQITSAQRAYIWDYILKCDASIGGAGFLHPVTGLSYRDYLARDSFIDHHMFNAFAKNVDGLRISTYFEKDRGGKLQMSSIWDFDRSMDSDTDNRDDNPAVWNPDNDSGVSSDFFSVDGKTAEGWFHRLHQDPDYLQEWVDRFDRWRVAEVMSSTAMNEHLDLLAATLVIADNNNTASANTAAARNWGRWPRTVRGTAVNGANAVSQIYGSGSTSELSRHKTWITNRIDFMDSWVVAKPACPVGSGVILASTPIGLSAPATASGGVIRYTLDGTDPRAPGGGAQPGALTYGGAFQRPTSGLTVARTFHASATNKHSLWSAPLEVYHIVGAEAAAPLNLGIRELMYHPSDPSPAEILAGFTDADQFEYLELKNLGSQRVNLWECRFADGITFAFRDAINPALVELNPGETLLVVKNPAAFSLRYGAGAAARVVGSFAGNDNLNNAGETITLLDRTGAVLLSFTYDDANGWPVSADGGGSSLHYVAGPLGSPAGWFAFAGNPALDPADSDGDGQSNLFEVLAGTHPGDANDWTALSASVNTAGLVEVTFEGHAGKKYRVHGSDDLISWNAVSPELVPVSTGPVAVQETPASARRYYRLEALPVP